MGLAIALTVIFLWLAHLVYVLTSVPVDFASPLLYLHVSLQGYLYTGLFITAHDAMHGSVSRSKTVNTVIGTVASILFAALSYSKLRTNHSLHHGYPAQDRDPDYCQRSQNFFIWWGTFLFRYATILQIVIMAIVFNVLKLWIPEPSIWFFWVVPALLGSFQLFFVGTYLPHRLPHTDAMGFHRARTQRKNHFLAMLSCYFFGYHYEHHEWPTIPWWQLYRTKQQKPPGVAPQ